MKEVDQKVKVAVVMGSKSDWDTMHEATKVLREWGIEVEARVVSAHRTPDLMVSYAKSAVDRGLQVIIAGAGGAAHLPGMLAAMTDLPVIGVPIQSRALNGLDSLLSIVQMPKGTPVATVSIGEPGAANAAYLALKILALQNPALQNRLQEKRLEKQALITEEKLEMPR
jgi:5-(carboxyamino)imidazole ribonucleotide mutase